jgi:hypothetical protein
MSTSVLLNNVNHQALRIITARGAAWGDDVMSSVVFPSEFRNLQAHYPIVFQKTADGTGFQPIALFGLREGQNLFLTPQGWDAACLPMAVERQPFMIGRDGDELMVHLDLDSPRLSNTEGEPVFLPLGGNSEFLERMTALLLAVHEGVQATPAFVDALLAHELLESFVLDVELDDGTQSRLAGLYTLHEDRLAGLGPEALGALHRAGHLQAVYMVLASLSNLRGLIDRQNRALRDRNREGRAG